MCCKAKRSRRCRRKWNIKYWKIVFSLMMLNLVLFIYKVSLFDESLSPEVSTPRGIIGKINEDKERKVNVLITPTNKTMVKDNISYSVNSEGYSVNSEGYSVNSEGYSLARYVQHQCSNGALTFPNKTNVIFWMSRMNLIPKERSLYCPVEKVGTTFWRRILVQIQHKERVRHPFQVPIFRALTHQFQRPHNNSHPRTFKNFFKFAFVRDPYNRILSAYIDKLFVPNPLFWQRFGKPSIQMFRVNDTRKCFHDVTFAEFVQFVVWSEKYKQKVDPHFLMAAEMCLPCTMNFTFIGKMESFKKDAIEVLNTFRLNTVSEILDKNMKDYADDDAIVDTISSPFEWIKDILKCMSWDVALKKMWRKLQLRGLIEFKETYPFSKMPPYRVRKVQFIKSAREARLRSDRKALKAQKKLVFMEMYRSVPLEVLYDLKRVFHKEFYLFNYTDTPNEIFDRSMGFNFTGVTQV